MTTLLKLGDPSDNKFDYPVGKRRNQATVTQLRNAEHRLDTFWAKGDELVLAKVENQDGHGLPEASFTAAPPAAHAGMGWPRSSALSPCHWFTSTMSRQSPGRKRY
jgi:hypothetical protein